MFFRQDHPSSKFGGDPPGGDQLVRQDFHLLHRPHGAHGPEEEEANGSILLPLPMSQVPGKEAQLVSGRGTWQWIQHHRLPDSRRRRWILNKTEFAREKRPDKAFLFFQPLLSGTVCILRRNLRSFCTAFDANTVLVDPYLWGQVNLCERFRRPIPSAKPAARPQHKKPWRNTSRCWRKWNKLLMKIERFHWTPRPGAWSELHVPALFTLNRSVNQILFDWDKGQYYNRARRGKHYRSMGQSNQIHKTFLALDE